VANRLPEKISLVVTDVDGTLLDPVKNLSPAAVAAVRRLGAAGIGFAVISSRPPRGLRMLVEPLGLTTPLAGFNGGAITTTALEPLESHILDPDAAGRAVAALAAGGADIWVFAGDDWLLRDPEGPCVPLERYTVEFDPLVVADFGPALDRAAKIVGVSEDHPALARLAGATAADLGAAASVARSQPYYLDVTPPRANKGDGIRALSRLTGVPPEEIAVLGDGENDVPMFQAAGFAVAMGNAAAEVQAAADAVTAGNDADGFAKAVARWILRDQGD
jgi:hypothetical protein